VEIHHSTFVPHKPLDYFVADGINVLKNRNFLRQHFVLTPKLNLTLGKNTCGYSDFFWIDTAGQASGLKS